MDNAVTSKTNVAVLFGGRSVEHEISIITALEVIGALDVTRFNAVPVYLDPFGRWHTGPELLEREFYRDLPESLERLREVVLFPMPGAGGLTVRKPRGLCSQLFGQKETVIPIDVYFLAFHGQFGEDGCIQGLLELADVPYTGCDVLASSVAMDKSRCKALVTAYGIPVLPSAIITKKEFQSDLTRVREKILSTPGLGSFPLFVKPSHLGSSVGISRADDERSLDAALVNVFRYDTDALVEPCLTDMFEINVSVLAGNPPTVSVVEVPNPESGTLTYEEKYMRGGKKKGGKSASQGMASLARRINPDDLKADYKDRARDFAAKCYDIVGCSGVVRFDFIVDRKKGEIYFNELNPLPGSLAFYLWEKSEPPVLYTEMLTRIIDSAFERKNARDALERHIGFRALFS